jgi:hypothetical protein
VPSIALRATAISGVSGLGGSMSDLVQLNRVHAKSSRTEEKTGFIKQYKGLEKKCSLFIVSVWCFKV